MKKRSLSVILMAVCFLFCFQGKVMAAEKGSVHVIVENQTWTTKNAPWTKTKVDTYVDVTDDMTADSAILKACDQKGVSYDYAESYYGGYYINGIGGILSGSATGAGDSVSGKEYWDGWLISINDWFMNQGSSNYKIADGSLKAGDVIKATFSRDGGPDVGSDYANTDKTLKNLVVSTGSLNRTFSSKVSAYELVVADDKKTVKVTPTATNKNFQVKMYVGTKEYSRNAMIPVSHGTKITVVCGRNSWPTSVNGADKVKETSYTITVKTKEGLAKESIAKRINLKGESKSYQSAKISWTKISGATGYKVYRKTGKNGSYKKIKTTKATALTDGKKKTGTTYYYKVRAYKSVDGKTIYGTFSNVKGIQVVPGTVSVKKVSQKGSYLKTTWKKVSGATGYRVYIKKKGAKKYKRVYQCGKNKFSYTKKIGMNGKTYFVKVRAYKTVNQKKIFGKFSVVKSIIMKK